MRKLKAKEVDFDLEVLPEDLQVEGNASAIDDETDKEIAAEIYRQLESGNEWAWCTVRVIARWKGYEGDDYLGGCSYKSRKDFETPGGYLEDMKAQALERLNETIASHCKKLKTLCQPISRAKGE